MVQSSSQCFTCHGVSTCYCLLPWKVITQEFYLQTYAAHIPGIIAYRDSILLLPATFSDQSIDMKQWWVLRQIIKRIIINLVYSTNKESHKCLSMFPNVDSGSCSNQHMRCHATILQSWQYFTNGIQINHFFAIRMITTMYSRNDNSSIKTQKWKPHHMQTLFILCNLRKKFQTGTFTKTSFWTKLASLRWIAFYLTLLGCKHTESYSVDSGTADKFIYCFYLDIF